LNLEINLCHAEESDLNFDSLTDMFNKEKKRFDSIMGENDRLFKEAEEERKKRDDDLTKKNEEAQRKYDERLELQKEESEKEV